MKVRKWETSEAVLSVFNKSNIPAVQVDEDSKISPDKAITFQQLHDHYVDTYDQWFDRLPYLRRWEEKDWS